MDRDKDKMLGHEPAPKVAPRAKPVQVNGIVDKAETSDGKLYVHCTPCNNVYQIKCPVCGDPFKA